MRQYTGAPHRTIGVWTGLRSAAAGWVDAPASPIGQGSCREPRTAPGAPAETYEDAFAVAVPGMSEPQNGCDETGVNPDLPALTIHAQLFESCPKSVL